MKTLSAVMFLRTILFWGLLISSANAAEDRKRFPKSITLSHVEHPVFDDVLIPYYKAVYGSLGIKASFVVQPSLRNLYLANSGQTGGDLAYSELLLKSQQNLVKVGRSILESQFVLLCHTSADCSADVLLDAKQTLVLTDSSHGGLQGLYGDKLRVKPYLTNSLARIPPLVNSGRASYGIYVLTSSHDSLKPFANLHYTVLFKTPTFHVLNKKYIHMVDAVKQKMELFRYMLIENSSVNDD